LLFLQKNLKGRIMGRVTPSTWTIHLRDDRWRRGARCARHANQEEHMLNFLMWLIFGAIAGWIASLIMGTNRSQGLLMDIIMGIVGAFIGGFLSSWLLNRPVTNNPFDIVSLLIAIVGAIILTLIVRALTGARRV